MHDKTPLVSVCMITYNHERFISKAIEGIISQNTDFDYEVVIGEDCSTDKTRAIIDNYAEKYPVIRLLPQDRNYGVTANFGRTLLACKGKYIAICEGDDYWIDPLKLQKQVSFLEANPAFSLCFSDVEIKDEIGLEQPYPFPEVTKDDFTIQDFILSEQNLIPTPSLIIKNVLPNPLPEFFQNALGPDMALQLIIADKGLGKRLSDKTAVYRQHAGGVSKSEQSKREGEERLFQLYIQADEYFGKRYSATIRQRLLAMSKIRLLYGTRRLSGLKKLKHIFKNLPVYLKYSDRIDFRELLYFHLIWFFPGVLKLIGKK